MPTNNGVSLEMLGGCGREVVDECVSIGEHMVDEHGVPTTRATGVAMGVFVSYEGLADTGTSRLATSTR